MAVFVHPIRSGQFGAMAGEGHGAGIATDASE
jgi:hypothetical protein